MTRIEQDRNWLLYHIDRLNMTVWKIWKASRVVNNPQTIYRVIEGKQALSTNTRAALSAWFETATPIPRIDYTWLRKQIAATGLTPSRIRRHADVRESSVVRLMNGRRITDDVYTRLMAWINAGAPRKPPRERATPEKHEPYKPCGKAFVLAMLERIGGGDYMTNPNTAYHTPETPDQYYWNGRTVQN